MVQGRTLKFGDFIHPLQLVVTKVQRSNARLPPTSGTRVAPPRANSTNSASRARARTRYAGQSVTHALHVKPGHSHVKLKPASLSLSG